MEAEFWKNKSLKEMNEEEWESLCDGCGKCCYRKYIQGRGKKEKLFVTSVACDFLDLQSGLCSCYSCRFVKNPECTHLTKNNLEDFYWLPDTCAYRLLYEKKELPQWHPLISGNRTSVKDSGVQIKDGIHEKDVEYWEDYIIEEFCISDLKSKGE